MMVFIVPEAHRLLFGNGLMEGLPPVYASSFLAAASRSAYDNEYATWANPFTIRSVLHRHLCCVFWGRFSDRPSSGHRNSFDIDWSILVCCLGYDAA
jgi:hypothetical protein